MIAHDAKQFVVDLRCTCSTHDGAIACTRNILFVAKDDEAQVGFLPLGVLTNGLFQAAILTEEANFCYS